MNDISIKREDIFVESIFDVFIPNIDNENIFDFFVETKKKEAGKGRSNIGGWQFDMKSGMCEAFDVLIDRLEYSADHIINNVLKMNINVRLSNSWLNHSLRGGLNTVHTHPGAIFSGAYYIKTNPDSGMINFLRDGHHNVESTLFYQCNEYVKSPDRDRMFRSTFQKQPIDSHAYLFSSWLTHEVFENTTDNDRLVTGFNFTAM